MEEKCLGMYALRIHDVKRDVDLPLKIGMMYKVEALGGFKFFVDFRDGATFTFMNIPNSTDSILQHEGRTPAFEDLQVQNLRTFTDGRKQVTYTSHAVVWHDQEQISGPGPIDLLDETLPYSLQ